MKFPDQNIVGRTTSHQIMKTNAWARAKEEGDFIASNLIIDQLWSEKKSEQLRNVFSDSGKIIFISQPSTSGANVLAGQFAKKLASEIKADFVLGDNHVIASHQEQSKKISFTKRAFHPREYEIIETEALKEAIGDKEVCLVEDVITSGGSVAAFTKALNREGIEVKSIAALTGERRLNIDKKTHDRLEQALQAKNINMNIQYLANSLTRMEAGGIIMTANSAKSEIAIERLETDLKDRIQHEQNQEFAHQQKETDNSNTVSELVSEWTPGHDHTPEQMKAERDPDLTDISPKIGMDLNLPKINTAYKNEWAKELDESQKLVEQEYSKEMPQEQERHQEQLDQLKQNEQDLEKEPQFELGR